MSKLQKLQCDNCGGKIDGVTLTCQSCGMQYRLNDDMTLCRVEVFNKRFVTLEGQVGVPTYLIYDENELECIAETTLRSMSEKMAEKLLPFMEFQTMFNPTKNSLDTYGRVQVAIPTTHNGEPVHQLIKDLSTVKGA